MRRVTEELRRSDEDALPALRVATGADADAVARLVTQLGYPTDADAMSRRLAAIEAVESRRTFVAELDGQVVGLAGAEHYPSYAHDGRPARLMAVVVDRAWRGRGIGRRLVRHAEEWLRAAGAIRVDLGSRLDRVEAHAFWERLGYVPTGQRFARGLRREGE